uniref:kelch-like protein 8 n=1 Tax=Styela clava TaxID=7725 RepID=UPI0019395E23|nr:kelch-like protein 8 [Styela clava]
MNPLDAYDLKHCGKMMMALNEQRASKEYSDFAIMVGDEKIPAHRNVLSAGSDYFRAMLSHENVESSTGIVKMKQVQYSSVKICINYIYTGNFPTPGREGREQLMFTAHMLQLQGMCDEIAISLEEELTPESFYSTKMIANTFNCTGLVESCNKYALRNFQLIAAEDDFKHLDKDYVSFLLESKEVNASEAVKCKAVIIWTNFDAEARASTFEELFGNLDLTKISRKYQKFLLEKEPLVFNSNRCLRAFLKTFTGGSQVVAEDIDIKDAGITTSQLQPNNVIAVFDKNSKAIQAFNPKMKTWTKLQAISDEFVGKGFTVAVLGYFIYVLVIDGTNYQLNYIETNATWVRLADRKETKKRVAAVAFKGSIYAFDSSGSNSKTVEKFDSSDGTWSHVTDKPVEGFDTSVVAAGGFIYCIGGYKDGRISNAIKFKPSDSTWTTLPSMPTARDCAAAVKLDGKIYVMGGQSNDYLNIVECFDTVSETWTTVARLNNPRGYFKACVVEGKIFAVGGLNSKNTIEEYDPAVNSWKVVETMGGKDIQGLASIALNVETMTEYPTPT